MEVEIKKCNTSVLKNNRFSSHRNDSLSPTKKKVMFESGTVKQHSHFSEHNSLISPKPISQSPGRRRHSRQSSSKSDKKIQIVNKDSGFVEVIEPNGEIKKEKIKIDTSKKEFQITRNSNNAGEFSKAQEFYNKNKENDEIDDYVEDTLSNTMRNQYVGQIKNIDGMAHAPLKNVYQ